MPIFTHLTLSEINNYLIFFHGLGSFISEKNTVYSICISIQNKLLKDNSYTFSGEKLDVSLDILEKLKEEFKIYE